ncbi:unnamed protein product, partial [Rotaria sp. Silwood2]
KYQLLNKDRIIFCRQRTLIPLNIITEHIRTTSKLQQSILNDFLEHIIRSTSPISTVLFDLIQNLLKSKLDIDIIYLEYFSNTILFDMKKDIFSNEQLDELHEYCNIRMKRFGYNNQIQLWEEHLNKQKKFEKIGIQNPTWYFIILMMTSSGRLNKNQYECVLKSGIQSTLFNSIQKFYFQYYLNQEHAPITIDELNLIQTKLKSQNIDEKKLAYEQIKIILDRPKPKFINESVN